MTRLILGVDRRGGDPIPRPGEIARGDYWLIVREGEAYVLRYLSRRLVGREEHLVLKEHEANAIAAGKAAVEHYLPD